MKRSKYVSVFGVRKTGGTRERESNIRAYRFNQNNELSPYNPNNMYVCHSLWNRSTPKPNMMRASTHTRTSLWMLFSCFHEYTKSDYICKTCKYLLQATARELAELVNRRAGPILYTLNGKNEPNQIYARRKVFHENMYTCMWMCGCVDVCVGVCFQLVSLQHP